ncbi:UPF0489 protein C5orf22 homolog [Plodia interpunctella]|uniref:UPF0489 protein C5orf22 homolog n=1 Tax=Plodia interpunctella TaxID=58824 RepID=UPI002367737C|nr:UPF0489 protein C5orf22 homolog [Plodia interpunctella]XP_053617999.1 UPF0489 protein C5orf22 homolog [Plodia interpunctella]XP_053618005.1 UPF0489 protein C5orf22 homolog [Plodia interpunctella]
MPKSSGESSLQPLKRFKKIPVYVVEEHNEALQFIYSAIGGKKLPCEGTTLLHFDSHPDMLIDRKLKGEDARAGRNLLPLLQIENWIVPAAAAGYLGRVVWLRPPWATQLADGTRAVRVGDHPRTGLLRVDCKEPYYMSDALYSNELINERKFTLTVAEVPNPTQQKSDDELQKLVDTIDLSQPYVLDIDLDFFSTANPFLSLYDSIKLYDLLEPIFNFELPENDDVFTVEKVVESRERQLAELEHIFEHLDEHGNLLTYGGGKTELYTKVSALVDAVTKEAEKLGDAPDWFAVFAGGCTRDQGGLPHHISTEQEMRDMIKESLLPLLLRLPAPVLVTVARSSDDGYCPKHQVDLIQSLVLQILKEVYDIDDPALHYLTVNTN